MQTQDMHDMSIKKELVFTPFICNMQIAIDLGMHKKQILMSFNVQKVMQSDRFLCQCIKGSSHGNRE